MRRGVILTALLTSLLAACGVDGNPQRPAARGTAEDAAMTGADATAPVTAGDWWPLPGRFAETLPPEIVWGL